MARITPPALDALDRHLLDLLQANAARPLNELGEAVGLSASAVQRRLTRYRASGLIAREVAVLDPDAVPGLVLACVLVTLERESKRLHTGFQDRMRATPEVQQCYDLAGPWDYLVVLGAEGMPRCRAVIDELFLGAPNVQRYDTLFVLGTIKRGFGVPMRNTTARTKRSTT